MANPLKVLTQLSASKEAQFAEVVEAQKTVTISGAEAHLRVTGGGEISGSGAFKAAGAAQLGSTLAVAGNADLASALDVKGAAALSGTLGVVGAASLQSTLAVAGAADLNGALDVQGAANFQSNADVAGYMKVVGEMSGSGALNVGGASHLKGAAQLDSTLDVDGAVDFDSTLDVAGAALFRSDITGSGNLDLDGNADISGSLDVHGNAVVYGNLEVKGTMTTIESTTVTVADANIQLATVASPTDTTADGAGITILGATNKTFQWNDDGHGFTSSEHMNLAGGNAYKIDGKEVVAEHAGGMMFSADAGTGGSYFKASINNDIQIFSQKEDTSGGPSAIEINAVQSNVAISAAHDINLTAELIDVAGVASFANDITASAGLDVAGAANLQSTLAVAGVASFASDVSASAGLDVAGAAHIAGKVTTDDDIYTEFGAIRSFSHVAKNLYVRDDVVNFADTPYFTVESFSGMTSNVAMTVNNNAHITGTLAIDGVASFQSDISASAGLDVAGAANLQSTLAVGGVASFANDVSASANMDVLGNINIGNGSVYKINGEEVLSSAATATRISKNGSGDAYIDVSNNTVEILAAQGISVNGALSVDGISIFTSDVTASAGFVVAGAAALQGAVSMDAALNLSGSAFINITTPVVDGKYNVNDAIRALDDKAGQQANNINNNYNALRYLSSAFFDANGMAAFTSSFAAADIEKVAVDVLVQAGGSGPWTNDLLSVQVKAAGAYVGFEISAPAMNASDKVRIIAVKESGSLA